MKQIVKRMTVLWLTLGSLMLLPSAGFAISLFNTESGNLVIPEVDVDGVKFFDNVTLKLDFATGTFKVVTATPKPDNISITPIDTKEVNGLKIDFIGCTRSGRNEVTCHIKETNIGEFSPIGIWGNTISGGTTLLDNLGNFYVASEVKVGDLKDPKEIYQDLNPGVPILIDFKFKNISPNAISFPTLSLTFNIHNTWNQETFKNIKL